MAEDTRIKALRRAIDEVGSQSAMARLLGITQASVWGWLKRGTPLPPQHVLAVEAATGVSRHDLRPDIYPLTSAAQPSVAAPTDMEAAR